MPTARVAPPRIASKITTESLLLSNRKTLRYNSNRPGNAFIFTPFFLQHELAYKADKPIQKNENQNIKYANLLRLSHIYRLATQPEQKYSDLMATPILGLSPMPPSAFRTFLPHLSPRRVLPGPHNLPLLVRQLQRRPKMITVVPFFLSVRSCQASRVSKLPSSTHSRIARGPLPYHSRR